MVIYLFLRNIPATIIPSLSAPLSLVGALAIMYQFDFSLDNLSLMALTVATGFVVDDAIVSSRTSRATSRPAKRRRRPRSRVRSRSASRSSR